MSESLSAIPSSVIPAQQPMAVAVPQAAAPVAEDMLPGIGPLTGQAFLNPSIAPKVAQGSPRPLAPGEYVKNPDGSWSSEITVTVQDPVLNGGKPSVVPSLWIINGVPTRVSEDQAAAYAAKSGLMFPAYGTAEEAESASQKREDSWQNIEPQNAGTVAPLWTVPPPAVQQPSAQPTQQGVAGWPASVLQKAVTAMPPASTPTPAQPATPSLLTSQPNFLAMPKLTR